MADKKQPTRREFLCQAAAGIALAGTIPSWSAGTGQVPLRPLGKTGEKVSLMCLGGFHIGSIKDDQESIAFIRQAIDMGVTFMDNAWEYHNGRSEELMGRALQDGYREKVFLMTKHHGRDKKTALKHLDDSLRRFKTDTIDLWQFHEVVYQDDPEMIFAAGGGIEAAEEAKKAGKVRYIGFTGHKDPMIHLKMLAYDYDWDATQMPLNVLDPHYQSFEKHVLPICLKRGIGVIGMKSLAGGRLLNAGVVTAAEAIRYAMSLPVASVVSGVMTLEHLKANAKVAQEFEPYSETETAALLARTEEAAQEGKYELFKSTNAYDGPVGRALHGVG